ncbi:unnamed protein product [Fusarium graminearum]|uniref:Chromosome 1, complete genome n=2 Tax=Gibberella zeae TaxID=5518 RepID=A0A0E0RN60_GIBZE|nr:hypothetical protein FG05_30047 [Fusarium graminearum]CAF3448465.1 unnamed protein product [Fusarium graminearum]CAF3515239.1 unnamed protein product [Fusarium graminearum]CAF3583012.1 unnamed protein product [Fusarium graminearum]CAG1980733.1 unnamed protein product [Fusarium graminearum]
MKVSEKLASKVFGCKNKQPKEYTFNRHRVSATSSRDCRNAEEGIVQDLLSSTSDLLRISTLRVNTGNGSAAETGITMTIV